MLSATQLQEKIRTTIPLSDTMQFSITELTASSIVVQAPLSPNVNIHGTGFAGSIYSLAVLTGWALVTHIMELQDMVGDLVVAKAEIKYRRPVTDDILCQCNISEDELRQVTNQFAEKGKSRLALDIEVGDGEAMLSATFFIVSTG